MASFFEFFLERLPLFCGGFSGLSPVVAQPLPVPLFFLSAFTILMARQPSSVEHFKISKLTVKNLLGDQNLKYKDPDVMKKKRVIKECHKSVKVGSDCCLIFVNVFLIAETTFCHERRNIK